MKIYVEGGGDGPATITACRRGFSEFFAKMLPDRQQVSVLPYGGRKQAYDAFALSVRDQQEGERAILLVGSEEPVAAATTCWQHLRNRPGDGWSRPEGAGEEDVHLMVQTVESWFLADPETLAKYYGQGFKPEKLPMPVNNQDIESHLKATVYKGLESAIKSTRHKKYNKSDGFAVIGLISPQKVCKVSAHARKLEKRLRKLLRVKRV